MYEKGKSELFLPNLASFHIFPNYPGFPSFQDFIPKYKNDFGFESNFQMAAISLFFIAKWAVKYKMIANPLKLSYSLKRGNVYPISV